MAIGQPMMLEVFDTGTGKWLERVRKQLRTGRNFFLILPSRPEAVGELCAGLGLEPDCLPKQISRADFLLLSQHVSESGFDLGLSAFNAGRPVIFLEQLDFPYNRPPRIQRFIVYSPTYGILSHHARVLEARKALAVNNSSSNPLRPKCEAVLYEWDGRRWVLED